MLGLSSQGHELAETITQYLEINLLNTEQILAMDVNFKVLNNFFKLFVGIRIGFPLLHLMSPLTSLPPPSLPYFFFFFKKIDEIHLIFL